MRSNYSDLEVNYGRVAKYDALFALARIYVEWRYFFAIEHVNYGEVERVLIRHFKIKGWGK